MEKATGNRWMTVLNRMAEQLVIIGAAVVLFPALTSTCAIGLAAPGPAAAYGLGLWLLCVCVCEIKRRQLPMASRDEGEARHEQILQQLASNAANMQAMMSAHNEAINTLTTRVSKQKQVLKALLQYIISLQEQAGPSAGSGVLVTQSGTAGMGAVGQPHELQVQAVPAPKPTASLTVEKVAGIINQLCPNVNIKAKSIAWLITVDEEGCRTGRQAPPPRRTPPRRVLSTPARTTHLEDTDAPVAERADTPVCKEVHNEQDTGSAEPVIERADTPVPQMDDSGSVAAECAETPMRSLMDADHIAELAHTPINNTEMSAEAADADRDSVAGSVAGMSPSLMEAIRSIISQASPA